MTTTTSNVCDRACAILRATSDGNSLRPYQLGLIQTLVNSGDLSEEHLAALELLEDIVQRGVWRKYLNGKLFVDKMNNPEMPDPTTGLHGVEHLDYDNEGYIYWRGSHVEHYDNPTAPEMAESARKLGETCLHIESLGLRPSINNTIWRWERYRDMRPDYPYLRLLAGLRDSGTESAAEFYEHPDGRIAVRSDAYYIQSLGEWSLTEAPRDFQLSSIGFKTMFISPDSQLESITEWLKAHNVPADLLDRQFSTKALSSL